MSHWVPRFFVVSLLFPLLVVAQERRDAIVVLSDPPVIEQMMMDQPERPLRRGRLASAEGEDRANVLRYRKGSLAAAVRQTGAELIGSTEVVLNTLLVRATPVELEALRRLPGVESAQFAREYRLLLDAAVPLVQAPGAWALVGGETQAGAGIKIAIIDNGIDQTHPMFQDGQLKPPKGYPLGDDQSLVAKFTNNKVIVVRDFTTDHTGADNDGHGTFVAGVAAGLRVQSVSPSASISGVAPKAFLGNYRVFPSSGQSASGTTVVGAIDAAVRDGMDIINLSLGSTSAPPPPDQDPELRAVQNAEAAGVLVVAAAGNDGPAARTISYPGGYATVLAVGATTNSRQFFATVAISSADSLGGTPAALPPIAALPSSQPKQTSSFGPAPLIDISAFDPSGLACPPTADFTAGVNLAPGTLSGQVVLIKRGQCFFRDKVQNVAAAGAAAAVIYNNVDKGQPISMDTTGSRIPVMSIGTNDGLALAAFLAAHQAQVTLDPSWTGQSNPADLLSDFSGRGPGSNPAQIVKPEMVAPGDSILSATQNANPNGELYSASRFTVSQGTSFAAPMVAGAAALVKQAHANFSPRQIKSALVNTAVPIAGTEDGAAVSAQNSGAGRLNVLAAITTPVLVEPTTLSFATHAPGSTFRATQPLKITNAGQNGDTFALRVVPLRPHPSVSVELNQTSVSLAPNQNAQVMVTLYNTGFVQTAAEGMVNITSQATGKSINVPYWVSFAMPQLNPDGVVNGASFRADNGVAPGSIVSVFGTALSSIAVAGATGIPLPTLLGGTKVVFNVDSGGSQTKKIDMPLFYSSSGQVNAQLPFEAVAGLNSSITIAVDGLAGSPINVPVAQFNPGLFSRSQSGTGPGAILHGNGAPVTSDNPALPGETVWLYATGLGAVGNSPGTGKAASANPLSTTLTTPAVSIGGKPAVVTFAGLAPGFVGLYQVNAIVPPDLGTNDQHPVVLNIGGASSNTVTLSVRQNQ